MLITTCPICLRHRPQRPPPCHPPPSPTLASTYEIDASPPSYSHLIMPCRHFRRVHIAFSTTTAIYTCSTHRRATCCHAIYAVTMPFHPLIAAAITTSTLHSLLHHLSLTLDHQYSCRLHSTPSQPALNAPNVPSRPLPPASIPQHGIIAPTSCPLDMSHRMIYIFVWPFCNSSDVSTQCFSCCAYSAVASQLLGLLRPLICLLSAILAR